jgi:predicted transcriptional regulator of viral defense system
MIAVAEPIDADTLRIRHEFLRVPGLHASANDVSRLLDVSLRHARLVLESLARDGFLERTTDGQFVRCQDRRLQ